MAPGSERDSGYQDLQRAVALYMAHADAGDTEVSRLLAEHEDLRELLAPMFASGPGDGDADVVVAGRRIAGYELVREVGRGGMGIVYEAVEVSLGRTVALKVLPVHLTDHADSLTRFRREATAAAGLDHPGIVRVHANGNDGDLHFIAMDFVAGAPLNRVLGVLCEHGGGFAAAVAACLGGDEEPPEPTGGPHIAAVVDVAAQVADALEHAHRQGVVHRDVKPANILVRRDGSVVLTDFGIARRESLPAMTRTGDTPGTPYYMAPEQVQAARDEVDHRADVFSLGVTLYELLCLRRPFDGATSQQVMQRIVSSEPEDPRRQNRELPSDLAAIVMMALEKDPGRRYQSAAAFAADLRAFLAYRPVVARPPGPARRLLRWARREPLRATLAGLLVLAVPTLAGLAGYWAAIQPALRAGETVLLRDALEGSLTDGFLALEELDVARAQAAFGSVLRRDPGNVEAIAGLVMAAGQAGAEASLRTIGEHERTGGGTPLLRLRAYVLDWTGRHDEAAALRARLGPVEGAVDCFVAGISEIALGHRGEAGAMERAAHYLELSVLTSERPRPLYHFERAHALGHLARPPQARAAAEVLQRLWPGMTEARFWAAFALGSTAPERAAQSIRAAIAAAPDRWLFHNNLGYYLQAMGDAAGARTAYRESLRLHPENAEACHDLAVVEERLGDRAAAEASYRRATAIRPDYLAVWVHLAVLLTETGRFADAEAAAQRALQIAPASADSQRVLGELRIAEGKPAAAIPLLRRALDSGPTARIAFFLGLALARTGDADGAIAAYRRSVELDPTDAEAHTNLGIELRRRKDRYGAEHHLRRAIEVDPRLPNPRRALWELLNEQGRKADLTAHCAAWVAALPDDPMAFARSAFTTLWIGSGSREENAKAALPHAERALHMSREIPAVLHDVGWVQHHAGQRERALATLREGYTLARRLGKDGEQRAIEKAIRSLGGEVPR